jgi:hypothetical protein
MPLDRGPFLWEAPVFFVRLLVNLREPQRLAYPPKCLERLSEKGVW